MAYTRNWLKEEALSIVTRGPELMGKVVFCAQEYTNITMKITLLSDEHSQEKDNLKKVALDLSLAGPQAVVMNNEKTHVILYNKIMELHDKLLSLEKNTKSKQNMKELKKTEAELNTSIQQWNKMELELKPILQHALSVVPKSNNLETLQKITKNAERFTEFTQEDSSKKYLQGRAGVGPENASLNCQEWLKTIEQMLNLEREKIKDELNSDLSNTNHDIQKLDSSAKVNLREIARLEASGRSLEEGWVIADEQIEKQIKDCRNLRESLSKAKNPTELKTNIQKARDFITDKLVDLFHHSRDWLSKIDFPDEKNTMSKVEKSSTKEQVAPSRIDSLYSVGQKMTDRISEIDSMLCLKLEETMAQLRPIENKELIFEKQTDLIKELTMKLEGIQESTPLTKTQRAENDMEKIQIPKDLKKITDQLQPVRIEEKYQKNQLQSEIQELNLLRAIFHSQKQQIRVEYAKVEPGKSTKFLDTSLNLINSNVNSITRASNFISMLNDELKEMKPGDQRYKSVSRNKKELVESLVEIDKSGGSKVDFEKLNKNLVAIDISIKARQGMYVPSTPTLGR